MVPSVEHHPADQLHVEVPHVQDTLASFAHHGEGLDQEVVERGAIGDALAEFEGLFAELFVGQLLDAGLERANLCNERAQPLYFSFVLGTDDFRE